MERNKKPLILLYHGIRNENDLLDSREEGASLYDISPTTFASHLDMIKDYPDPITITFDDGEENHFTQAFPLLKQRGLWAIFFLIIDRIGQPGYLTWPQIREMASQGMIFGSHSLSHRILIDLDDIELNKEIEESKLILERELKQSIHAFSIPRGYVNDRVISRIYAKGYQDVYISRKSPFISYPCLERMAIKNTWSSKRFQEALRGKTPKIEQIRDIILDTLKSILGSKTFEAIRSKILMTKDKAAC